MFSGVSRSKALRFDVASQVLVAIFRGQLQEGDRLVVKRLAEKLRVSATPTREALLELASFGAVELLPNKGAVVRPFGPQQIREIYHVRALLEIEAVRLGCGMLSAESLEALRRETVELIEHGDLPRWSERSVRCDNELHHLIAHGSGHRYLSHEIDRLSKLVNAARGLLEDMRRLQELAHFDHLKILDHLLREERDLAMESMKTHIQSACRVLVEEAFPREREPPVDRPPSELQADGFVEVPKS